MLRLQIAIKKAGFRICPLVLVSMLFHATASAADFRQHEWGDSRELAMTREGEPTKNEGQFLEYPVLVDGQRAKLTLRFAEDQLVNAIYDFVPLTSGRENVLAFFAINNLLINKYGAPADMKFMPEQLAGEANVDRATEMFAGPGAYWRMRWENPESTVMHVTMGVRGSLSQSVRYWSKQHADLIQKYSPKNNSGL